MVKLFNLEKLQRLIYNKKEINQVINITLYWWNQGSQYSYMAYHYKTSFNVFIYDYLKEEQWKFY